MRVWWMDNGRYPKEVSFYQKVIGELRKYGIRFVVDNFSHSSYEYGAGYVAHQIAVKVMCQRENPNQFIGKFEFSFQEPINFWQMFKRDHMPQWFNNFFPVKTRRIEKIGWKTFDISKETRFPEYPVHLGVPVRIIEIKERSIFNE